jgi:hypothetical protein
MSVCQILEKVATFASISDLLSHKTAPQVWLHWCHSGFAYAAVGNSQKASKASEKLWLIFRYFALKTAIAASIVACNAYNVVFATELCSSI